MKIFVTGIGWVGAAGMGSGRGPVPLSLPPGNLPHISRRDIQEEPDPRFGRLDAFSRIGLAAVALALRDAGLGGWTQPRAVGVFAATTYGCLSTDVDYLASVGAAPGLASPHLFAYTLPNVFLGEAAIRYGLTGPTVVVSDEKGHGTAALESAADYVADSDVAALAGICDLARPALLPERPAQRTGALFLVLERRPTLEPLGELTARANGRWGLDGADSLHALAQRLCAGNKPDRSDRSSDGTS